MKKLFLCVATALCSTFAFADEADLVVNPVTITNGIGTMEVVVNKTGTTAFQFDVKLPANVSATAFGLDGAPATRKFEKAHYNANDNTWRFLSYDESNTPLDAVTTFNITLAAADGATTGEAETTGILVVDPQGNGTDVDGASSVVTVSDGVIITIPAGKNLAMVSDQPLDFSRLEAQGVKAYICTGFELVGQKFWMTCVSDVPANTPILVRGEAGTYTVPLGSANTYYPTSFLRGEAGDEGTYDVDWTEGYNNYGFSRSTGKIGKISKTNYPTMDKGKAYIHVPASITSSVASSAQTFEMKGGGKLAVVSDYDLDFTNVSGLTAYVVVGFDKTRKFWSARVKKAAAGTPLLLKGTANTTYDVPSNESKVVYVNIMEGNTSSEAVTMTQIEGDYTIYALSPSTGKIGKISKTNPTSFVKGKAWFPVPTWFETSIPAAARGMISDSSEQEAEVICLEARGLFGDDDETTGIRSIDEGQFTNDVWYNLNGQRIDTPTKKGLYIMNGKKVLVK